MIQRRKRKEEFRQKLAKETKLLFFCLACTAKRGRAKLRVLKNSPPEGKMSYLASFVNFRSNSPLRFLLCDFRWLARADITQKATKNSKRLLGLEYSQPNFFLFVIFDLRCGFCSRTCRWPRLSWIADSRLETAQ